MFLLTLNGRSIRQTNRLIKSIYHDSHFYYFHIDKVNKIKIEILIGTKKFLNLIGLKRMTFLRNEIKNFIEKINRKNFFMPNWSMPTIWGGSSLLQMHLRVMQDLLEMKENGDWKWDFLLNLSETDFPIKFVLEQNPTIICLNYIFFYKDLSKI